MSFLDRLDFRWHSTSLTALLLVVACRQTEPPSHLTSIQQEIIKSVEARSPGWRLAAASDNRDTLAIRSARNGDAAYNPYVAIEQADTHEANFAFALIRDTLFRVYYVHLDQKGYLTPQEVAEVDWLNTGGLMLSGDTLSVAPFNSDEIFLFAWHPEVDSLVLVESPDDSKGSQE